MQRSKSWCGCPRPPLSCHRQPWSSTLRCFSGYSCNKNQSSIYWAKKHAGYRDTIETQRQQPCDCVWHGRLARWVQKFTQSSRIITDVQHSQPHSPATSCEPTSVLRTPGTLYLQPHSLPDRIEWTLLTRPSVPSFSKRGMLTCCCRSPLLVLTMPGFLRHVLCSNSDAYPPPQHSNRSRTGHAGACASVLVAAVCVRTCVRLCLCLFVLGRVLGLRAVGCGRVLAGAVARACWAKRCSFVLVSCCMCVRACVYVSA